MKLIQEEPTLATAAAKAGMDEKTARKYRDLEKLPSQTKRQRTWRTRKDAFEEVWPEVLEIVERDEAVEAKTVFEYLNRQHPGRYQEGELRTLQRRIKVWGELGTDWRRRSCSSRSISLAAKGSPTSPT
jgi:hypothetical protein